MAEEKVVRVADSEIRWISLGNDDFEVKGGVVQDLDADDPIVELLEDHFEVTVEVSKRTRRKKQESEQKEEED